MLHEFVSSNRNELIDRCRETAAKRSPRVPASGDHGVPIFLQQLVDILRDEQTTPYREVEEPKPAPTEIGRAAALHGAELLRSGYSVDQVVHGYGDVCQAVTGLAVQQNAPVSVDEFRTLNRCLDNAIADAVTAFGNAHQNSLNDEAGELLRLVDIITTAYAAIQTGHVGFTGATGSMLNHALTKLRSLADRSLPVAAKVKFVRRSN
jgi:hypothetical protein